MARMPDGYLDLIVTDPPYALVSGQYSEGKKYSGGFMSKIWDAQLPSVEIWKECLRVLKPGAFAFIMCAPRQDVLSQMIVNLTQAGFRTDFTSLYHVFAQGFPKAGNLSKLADKKLGAEREVIGNSNRVISKNPNSTNFKGTQTFAESAEGREASKFITAAASPEAKKLAGSFTGFNPKPALEVCLVVMRPLECKTFTEQAMKNGKGCTWLTDCMFPVNTDDKNHRKPSNTNYGDYDETKLVYGTGLGGRPVENLNSQGRFPANLLVSDDALNDGNVYETHAGEIKGDTPSNLIRGNVYGDYTGHGKARSINNDEGSFSRYFSLDSWWAERLKNFPKSVLQTFPFLIEPKASKREKNFGLNGLPLRDDLANEYGIERFNTKRKNIHPTVKPVKLMSYLITLGSREGEIVYDPFAGSCTTGVAAEMLNRKWILSEMDKDSCTIGEKRLYPFKIVQKLF